MYHSVVCRFTASMPGQPDAGRRPFRARRSTWGLTGTPLLSSEFWTKFGKEYFCFNS